MARPMQFLFDKVENILENGENSDLSAFLLFSTLFSKGVFRRVGKLGILWYRLKDNLRCRCQPKILIFSPQVLMWSCFTKDDCLLTQLTCSTSLLKTLSFCFWPKWPENVFFFFLNFNFFFCGIKCLTSSYHLRCTCILSKRERKKKKKIFFTCNFIFFF